MTRTEESRITSIVEKATHQGFDLRFNYSVNNEETKPESVHVYGNKQVGETNMHLNASVSKSGESIQFSGMESDSTLSNAIFTELRAILNTEI